MTDNKSIPEKNEIPILSLIQQVKDGTIDPKTLDKELRQACVEVFLVEGYSLSNMAQILNRSEKTIHRDIDEIRDRNALSPDADLAKKLIGELLVYSRSHRDHLMRLARSKEGSISERAQAEYYAARVWLDLTARLQSLGYLPLQPQALEGEIFHHFDANKAQEISQGLVKEIVDIEKTAQETIGLSQPIQELLQKTKKALEEQPQKKEGDNDVQNS